MSRPTPNNSTPKVRPTRPEGAADSTERREAGNRTTENRGDDQHREQRATENRTLTIKERVRLMREMNSKAAGLQYQLIEPNPALAYYWMSLSTWGEINPDLQKQLTASTAKDQAMGWVPVAWEDLSDADKIALKPMGHGDFTLVTKKNSILTCMPRELKDALDKTYEKDDEAALEQVFADWRDGVNGNQGFIGSNTVSITNIPQSVLQGEIAA